MSINTNIPIPSMPSYTKTTSVEISYECAVLPDATSARFLPSGSGHSVGTGGSSSDIVDDLEAGEELPIQEYEPFSVQIESNNISNGRNNPKTSADSILGMAGIGPHPGGKQQ